MRSNTQATIEKIHAEFDSAQDRLLEQAKEIISGIDIDNKAERLEKLGFTGAEVVVKQSKKKEILVKNKSQAELIEYYKQTYPFQKFITESEMDRICEKYGLVYAPVSAYLKDVPEKNLTEIEQAANLKRGDSPWDIEKCRVTLVNFVFPDRVFINWWYPLYYRLPRIIDRHCRNKYDADDYYKANYKTGSFEYMAESVENITISKQGLFIAAPPSHFNKSGLLKKSKYGYFNFSVIIPEVKDPIVFRYVKGGIQILSKWGPEASDPLVVNEKKN